MLNSEVLKTPIRRSFRKNEQKIELPNLVEIQFNSYKNFLQLDSKNESIKMQGLHEVFHSVFPIQDYAKTATIEYVSYKIDEPKFDVEECLQKGISYAAALRVVLRLIVWETDEDTDSSEIKSIKEQEVFLGDMPLMTATGTFIVNGIERVVVSQIHRSPGVFFDHDKGKTHSSGKYLYSARIIPYRGSWLDFEFDPKDLLFFRIDRKRKLHVSSLLFALGLSRKEIFETFYETKTYTRKKDKYSCEFNYEKYKGIKLLYDIIDADTNKVVAKSGTKLTPRSAKKLKEEGFKNHLIFSDELLGLYLGSEIRENDEVIAQIGDEITAEILAKISELKLDELKILNIDNITVGSYIRDSLYADKNSTHEEALAEIYRILRPGEPSTPEASSALFSSLFFDMDRYDLSAVGRVKMNARLDLDFDEETRVLTKDDIIAIIKTLVDIKDGNGEVDDIDHLGNRRIRSVGELLENQLRIGLVRMERAILERMGSVDVDTVMPHDLVNSKLLVSVLREFFGSSQLSQFMDQTNPLSEIAHKRRLSALGPGGLTRDRAVFEVRDVHTTHYARICPIETPEGQNIGLINSLASYARIIKYGFIETPYRIVKEGVVSDEVRYFSAIDEGKHPVAPSNVPTDSKGNITTDQVLCRKGADYTMVHKEEIRYVDVSPMQIVSVAASLIPFLENDSANRALMGSNMQRQAVPLVHTDAPFVGTGMEGIVAKDSGAVILASRDGIVDQIDSTRVVLSSKSDDQDTSPGVDIYNLQKYQRTNDKTCINQKPLVKVGDYVKRGDVIADGPCTDRGELALGRNVLCAFMSWGGYNFEDSILISDRIVKDDVYTSIHIEEFEVTARDTRLGPEEVTRDIPNVSEDNLKQLDEVGIVHVGAQVTSGDILVGKVTPKSESPMTAEEKLLRAIFGEKAADVRDTSLRLPPGVTGTVVEVRIFSRRGVEKDERALSLERQEIDRLSKDREDEMRIVENFTYNRLQEILVGHKATSGPKGFKANNKITEDDLESYSRGQYFQFVTEDNAVNAEIEFLKRQLDGKIKQTTARFNDKLEKLKGGDDLPQGALKTVKVFVAMKRKLQLGDKMAGRHGNKGIISRILPSEDMPYLEDGTPIDIILNPLGVPSRMNIGQILETHLGWTSAALTNKIKGMVEAHKRQQVAIKEIKQLILEIYKEDHYEKKINIMSDDEILEFAKSISEHGLTFASPVFDGAKIDQITALLKLADLDESGQVNLYDGRTGEPFDRKITVGYNYMLKLHHLVDEKIHARSIGPYSLVTQQPLGGKSHMGGQRFGEMECWALQGYGAAYSLQEMLTVKSDDVSGRVKIYDSIVRGDHNFESGIPESFNVMIKELRSLCLNVELEEEN